MDALISKIRNNPSLLWLLPVISGLLFWFSWPVNGISSLSFIALLPMLLFTYMNIDMEKGSRSYFFQTWLGMFVWNATTTWWIWNASPGGAIMAIVLNSLLMTIPFLLYRKALLTQATKTANTLLIVVWLSMEYLHHNWDLNWPWITIGNVFADMPAFIQWYEYTGILGGSLWVLTANVFIFHILITHHQWNPYFKSLQLFFAVFIVFAPIITSFVINTDYSKWGKSEIVVVQPNVDPYTEKFQSGDRFDGYHKQIEKMITLTESKLTEKTEFVIWPETAIQGSHNLNNLSADPEVKFIQDFLHKHPKLTLITGIEGWIRYKDGEEIPDMAKYSDGFGYYETYNSALSIEKDDVHFYHKSKLVPGVEKLPFPSLLGFIPKLINFQAAGNYATQEERTVFINQHGTKFSTLICYESVFGDFTGKFVQKGADFMIIITNDGWWGDTPGHRQHNQYARLRAIEHRRAIARSANTGISSFIAPDGSIIEQSNWWEEATLRQSVPLVKDLTFYTLYGDYIGRVAAMVTVLLLISIVIKSKTKIATYGSRKNSTGSR